jgi:hypothetical protein
MRRAAGEDEEDVDADETPGQPLGPGVEDDDRKDRDGAEPVDVGAVVQHCHGGALRPRNVAG